MQINPSNIKSKTSCKRFNSHFTEWNLLALHTDVLTDENLRPSVLFWNRRDNSKDKSNFRQSGICPICSKMKISHVRPIQTDGQRNSDILFIYACASDAPGRNWINFYFNKSHLNLHAFHNYHIEDENFRFVTCYNINYKFKSFDWTNYMMWQIESKMSCHRIWSCLPFI